MTGLGPDSPARSGAAKISRPLWMPHIGRFLLGLVLAGATTQGCSDRGAFEGRDVILVNIETLRSDFVGACGSPLACTPEMDDIAAHGIVVEKAYTVAPWTRPSVASLWTGLCPARHGTDRQDPQCRLPEGVTTVAEILRDAGYETCGFVTNANLAPELGFDQGFSRYVYRMGAPGSVLVDSVAAWLDAAVTRPDRDPLFIALHFDEPHGAFFQTSFFPSVDGRNRSDMIRAVSGLDPGRRVAAIERYRADIQAVDRQVGRLVRLLQEKLGDRFVVIITADHGEEWFDHGGVFHGFTLHRELLSVPLIIYAPGRPAARRHGPVRSIDIVPTITGWLGLADPKGCDGRYMGQLLSREGSHPRVVSAETRYEKHLESIERDGLKLIRNVDTGERLLFDLRRDPAELVDLSESRHRDAGKLAERLRELRTASMRRRVPREGEARSVALNAGQEARLRADLQSLGYVAGTAPSWDAWPAGTRVPWHELYDTFAFLEPNDSSIVYRPDPWRDATVPGRKIGGPDAGEEIEVRIETDEAYVVFGTHPWSGRAILSAGTRPDTSIDLYRPAKGENQLVVPVALGAGSLRTIQIMTTGQKNPFSHSSEVLFDGIIYRKKLSSR